MRWERDVEIPSFQQRYCCDDSLVIIFVLLGLINSISWHLIAFFQISACRKFFAGYPKTLIERFKDGFPYEWQDLLCEYYNNVIKPNKLNISQRLHSLLLGSGLLDVSKHSRNDSHRTSAFGNGGCVICVSVSCGRGLVRINYCSR